MYKQNEVFTIAFFCQILNIYAPLVSDIESQTFKQQMLPFVITKSLGEYIEPWEVELKGPNKIPKFSAGCNYLPFNKEFFLCPVEDDDLAKTVENINGNEATPTVPRHCLFVKKFDDDEIPRCVEEPTPTVRKLTVEEDEAQEIKCGPERVGTLYRFQYSLCFIRHWKDDFFGSLAFFDKVLNTSYYRPKIEKMNFRIYDFCYDHNTKTTIYTEHIILSPGLLDRAELREEKDVVFEVDTNGYEYFQDDFKVFQEYIENLNTVTLATPQTITHQQDPASRKADNLMLPYQLVPADDMVFATWKKPTFHAVNVKLMPEKLLPLWFYLCQLTQNLAKQNSSIHYKIFTGMFMLPLDDQRNGLIWVKIERNLKTKEELAVVMSDDYVDEILSKYCKVNYCKIPNDHSISQEVVDFGHHARCCPVTSDVKHLFGLSTHVMDNYQ